MLMAAEGGGGEGRGRGPCAAAARRPTFLLIAVMSALVHHSNAAARLVPHAADDGTSWPWTYGVSGYLDWRPAGLVAVTHGGESRSSTETPRRRPVDAVYSSRRRRMETDPYGRFIAGSSWKRRSMYCILYNYTVFRPS